MSLKVSRVLHAGYVFETSKAKILFDPIFETPFSRNCFAFPNVSFDLVEIRAQKFDAVFISHFHDDHFSFASLDHIDRETPIYFYCAHDDLFALLVEFGFRVVHRLGVDVAVQIADLEVTPRLALDPDVDAVFQLRHGEINVLNLVDAWIDPHTLATLQKYAPFDLVLWPFQTLREVAVLSPKNAEPADRSIPREWIEQLLVLNPRFVVPSSCQFRHESWSWYNRAMFPIRYVQFAEEIGEALPASEVRRLEPSQSVQITKVRGATNLKPCDPLRWIVPIGKQDVEYDFDLDLKPDSTSQIAKHFRKLTALELKRVFEYCQVELKMRVDLETEFERSAVWRLSLFDHEGRASAFEFKSSVDWKTEVPIAKLYAALEEGESLTSMYLRCQAPAGADVLQDPLIRHLFNGKIGSYQRAEIARLVSERNRRW